MLPLGVLSHFAAATSERERPAGEEIEAETRLPAAFCFRFTPEEKISERERERRERDREGVREKDKESRER